MGGLPGDDDDVQQIEFGTLAEQEDEAFYDDRSDADDDVEKGRIKFPSHKLYGRDKELKQLHDIYKDFCCSCQSNHQDNNEDVQEGKKQESIEAQNKPTRKKETSRVVFLAGYSGTGKSALVEEFIKQVHQRQPKNNSPGNPGSRMAYLYGKFGLVSAGDPFSAIMQAMNRHVVHLMETCSQEKLASLKARLAKSGIQIGSDDLLVLTDTLMPTLGVLLEKAGSESNRTTANKQRRKSFGGMVSYPISAIKISFVNFCKALATSEEPVTLFIDDLQWADAASLELLQALLRDVSLTYFLFVGAYRSNEVNEEHSFSKLMKDVKGVKEDAVTSMEIFSLSPESVGEFIADCIDKTIEEVNPIADAIYTKTLGNIFFVKQALEELVRKNAIYYDVVFFSWQFGDVSRVELEGYLSDDVLQMVQSKLQTMPEPLPRALALAAYTENTIHFELLLALLEAESIKMDRQSLVKLMNQAYVEGLVLKVKSGTNRSYKFAHDRIREAACASIPEGDERNQFLLRLASVLKDRGGPGEDDWMLFISAMHINSVPVCMTDPIDVARLNSTVSKIAISKGAYQEALAFLRAGNQRLDPSTCWREEYDLTLELKNNLAETYHFLGKEDEALEVAAEIMEHADSLPEKLRAQYVHIQSFCSKHGNDYSKTIEEGLRILALYGVDVPLNPTEKQVKGEKFRLKVALMGRSLMCLSKFPVSTDPSFCAVMKLAQHLGMMANFGKKYDFQSVFTRNMLRLALKKKVISKDTPYIVVCLGGLYREKQKYQEAIQMATIGSGLLARFAGETDLNITKTKVSFYSILGSLRLPFRDCIEIFLDTNKQLISLGDNELGVACGMLAIYSYYNSSLPVGAQLEPKLILFEETAVSYGRTGFAIIFRFLRQLLYNLEGGPKSSANPTELDGPAFNEENVLSKLPEMQKKMMSRDVAVVRSMLAVYFDDEAVMEQCLDRLDPYPIHDTPHPREYCRMLYVALASNILFRKYGKQEKWAQLSMSYFERLSKFGSPNAQPVYTCLEAIRNPSIAAFDEAIQACGNSNLLNLAALMNERCGLWLMEDIKKTDNAHHEEYLKCAVWLYHDWGALGKMAKLQQFFAFLQGAMHEKPPSQLSSVRRQAARLGVPTQI